MKKVILFMLLLIVAGLSALGQQTYTADEAHRLFDEKYQLVFGDEGCSLHYAVNIIGIYKTEGTICTLPPVACCGGVSETNIWLNGE